MFTHTSAAHHSHAHIDLFLMPGPDLLQTVGVEILAWGISDHSPVFLMMGSQKAARRPLWRLNAWFLTDKAFTEQLREGAQTNFALNVDSALSHGVLWAAAKATIRGLAKSLVRHQERDKQKKAADLEAATLRSERFLGS